MVRFVVILVGLSFLVGCGSKKVSTSTISGSVTYKGQAVNGAALILYDGAKGDNSVILPVTQEGTYRSTDLQPGDYKVVVQPSTGSDGVPSTKGMDPDKLTPEMKAKIEAMKSTPTIRIPEKYKQRATTDLTLKVVAGESTVNLELKD